jgi:hypothetical protein
MCRSIKVLRRPTEVATPEEISAAALQYVRKVSGYHKPSKSRQGVFEAAVRQIAEVTGQLLEDLRKAEGSGGKAAPETISADGHQRSAPT